MPKWKKTVAVAASFILITIGYPIVVDQGWLRYNVYVLPCILMGAVILYLALFFYGNWFKLHAIEFKTGHGVLMGLLAFILLFGFVGVACGIGFYYSLKVSKEHIAGMLQPEHPLESHSTTNAAKPTETPSEIIPKRDRQLPSADAEIKRRHNVLDKLRQEYIFSHDGVSAGLLAGTEYPPLDWINEKLKALGETWRFEDRDHPYKQSKYGGMTHEELRDATFSFTKKLRDFDVESIKKENEIRDNERAESLKVFTREHPNPDPPIWSKAEEPFRRQLGELRTQTEAGFKSRFESEAFALNDELSKRVDKQGLTEPVVLRSNGMLAGPDPMGELATYLELLARRLPIKANAP